jgi:sugar/nucleoside kinase (ribokinase family)
MDSSLTVATLVDAVTSLVLSPDNPCNTTITDSAAGSIVYTVKTEFPPQARPVTTVRSGAGDVVATSVVRSFFSLY